MRSARSLPYLALGLPLWNQNSIVSSCTVQIMTPRPRMSGEGHRVVCFCQAWECYLGQIVDARGNIQSGVEVTSQTQEAHTLLDRRNHIESRHSPGTSHHTRQMFTPPQLQHQADLISPLARFNISPPNSSSNTHTNTRPNSHGQRFASLELGPPTQCSQSSPLQEDTSCDASSDEGYSDDTSSDVNERVDEDNAGTRSQDESSLSPRICEAANAAQETGQQEYNCGRWSIIYSHWT